MLTIKRLLTIERLLPSALLLTALPVQAATLSGSVRDVENAPVAAATVELSELGSYYELARQALETGRPGHPALVTVRTDADGRFSLETPGTGLWQVGVTAPGFVPLRYLPVPVTGPHQLPPAVLRPDAGATVEVRDADGRPASGVLLFSESATPELWRGNGWQPAMRSARSDDHGRLVLPRAAGETLNLWASATATSLLARGAVGERTVLRLAAAALHHPIEVRETDGTPAKNVLVFPQGLRLAAGMTDTDGRFVLRSPPIEGALRIRLLAPADRALDSEVEGTALTQVDLPPRRQLAGRVVDETGQALSEALVWSTDTLGAYAVTDKDGRYEIPVGSLLFTDGDGRYEIAAGFPDPPSFRVEAMGYLPVNWGVLPETLRSGRARPLVLSRALTAFGKVVDLENRPLAGIDVRFRPGAGSGPLREAVAGAQTDGTGRFTVSSIAAGVIDVTADGEGYAPLVVRGIRLSAEPAAGDLGTLILEPGGDVRGTVRDTAGEPVAGASIRILEDHGESPSPRLLAQLQSAEPRAVTDARGGFAIHSLHPGRRIHLRIDHDLYSPGIVPGFEVSGEKDLEVVLEPASAVQGRVTDLDGEPIAGAELVLGVPEPLAGEMIPRQDRGFRATELTDEDGRFTFRRLRTGEYRLTAAATGFLPVTRTLAASRDQPSGDLHLELERGAVLEGRITNWRHEPVAGAQVLTEGNRAESDAEGRYRLLGIAPGKSTVLVRHAAYDPLERELLIESDTQTADFVLDGGFAVFGRVVDEDRLPVADAQLQLRRQARGNRDYLATSDDAGRFRVERAANGPYTIDVWKKGHARTRIPEAFEVHGDTTGPVEVVLPHETTVSGRILGLDFDDTAQVLVEALQAPATVLPGAVDYEGRYRIGELGPGDWVIRASLDSGRRQAEARVVVEPGERTVERDLELGRGRRLSGEVLYGGEPLRGALVSVRGHEVATRRTVLVDYDGGFTIDDLEPGSYHLEAVQAEELIYHNQEIQIFDDRFLVVEIDTTAIRGTVLSAATGKEVPEARVALLQYLNEDGSATGSLMSFSADASGNFYVAQATAGLYRLQAQQDGFQPYEEVLELRGGEKRIEVRLQPTPGLRMVVRNAAGEAPPFVMVGVFDQAGRLAHAEGQRPQADGSFHFQKVPAGNWELWVGAPGCAARRFPVHIPGTVEDVVLAPSTRLEVRVPKLTESNLLASLSLVREDGRPFSVVANSGVVQDRWKLVGGTTSVEGVPAGIWNVHVQSADGRLWNETIVASGEDRLAVSLP